MDLSRFNEAELVEIRAEAKERLKMLRSMPKEPSIGAVVSFQKMFGNRKGKKYHYAAVHSPNGWSVTGSAISTIVSWERLISFVKSDEWDLAEEALASITLLHFGTPVR